MRRSAIALLALTPLLAIAAVADAKLPKVKPKTGTYTGSEVDTKKPGVLKVSRKGHALRVASLKLVFTEECSDENGATSEKDVPIEVSGKLHRAVVTTDKNTFVRSYKFTAKKQEEGGPFYNLEVELPARKQARVTGLVSEQVNDASGNTVSECDSGTETWHLSHH
jgi:hypothetical protein